MSITSGTREDVDTPLVEALRRDDPDATDQLVERYGSRVYRLAVAGALRRELTAAFGALPPDYRTALVLHDVEGVANSEIAETLGVSLSAVKSRVHRARLFVRQRLSTYLESAS